MDQKSASQVCLNCVFPIKIEYRIIKKVAIVQRIKYYTNW